MLENLPISTSLVHSLLYFSIYFIWLLHTFYVYGILYHNLKDKNSYKSLSFLQKISENTIISSIVNSMFLIIIGLSFLNEILKESQGTGAYIIKYIGKQLNPYLRSAIEIFFYLSAFFSLSFSIFNTIAFILASMVSLVKSMILQNFTLRKDEFCCKSI